MKHISLFSGIGGFDLASEWMGWENIASCEINPFSNKILEYYWPDALHHNDVHTFTKKLLDEKVKDWKTDELILTGGFPCQPYSTAGKRKGKNDERHLWPEMLRIIREITPRWIVGENVRGLVNWNGGMVFDEVQSDLEDSGYEVIPFLLPACGKNAPHRRDRIWFIAKNTNNDGWRSIIGQKESNIGELRHFSTRDNERIQAYNGKTRFTTNTNSRRQPTKEYRKKKPGRITKEGISNNWENFPTQSPICSGDDGFPPKLDGITFPKWRNESIKGYGNAIVPQIAYEIFKAIDKYEKIE
jgi:DNA (cytosine-5)-methyltransferase 1